MAGFMAMAVIATIGIISTVIWIACVSLGIRRIDRHSLGARPGQLGTTPGRVSRLARAATGLHSL